MSDAALDCFVRMLSHLREPLLIASHEGHILSANAAAADALGTSVEALRGAPLGGYSPTPSTLAEQLGAPVPEMQFSLRARDGRRFSCDARELEPGILLLRLSGGAQQRAKLFRDELSSLRSIAAGPVDGTVAVARALLAEGMSALGAANVGVFLIDESSDNLELICEIGYDSDAADRFRIVPLTAELPAVDALKSDAPILLATQEDYQAAYPHFAPAHPEYQLDATACLRLDADGGAIGVLHMGFPRPWRFDEERQRGLRAFAMRCAAALASARRLDEADRIARAEAATSPLESLHAFTGALARALTPAEVAEAVVDMGMAATSARAGGLWLLSDDGTAVSLVRGVGPTGPRVEENSRVPLDRPERMPILDAVSHGAPVFVESRRQLEERYPAAFRAFCRGPGESSLACLPLFANGRCIGGLVYNFAEAQRFLADERAFLLVLARHAAQAIERARLYAAEKRAKEQAEANQRRSDLLARAGILLASSLDYAHTLAGVARAAVPEIADWCIVELEEERLRGVAPVVAHVDPAKAPLVVEMSRRFRELGDVEHGIPGVIRSGKSQLYHSISAEQLRQGLERAPVLAELLIGTGIASSMVVPISARGRTLGAILLNSSAPGRHYDEDDLRTAEELGRRVGLAVDNARLFHDAREADRRKDEFLAMLSHELRNPLAPLLTALDVMKLQGDQAFVRERAIMSRHLRHLVRLVDDLLDVSRVSRGKILLQPVRCEASAIIADAVEMASLLIHERSHRLTVSAPETGLLVAVDQVRLTQAVANLLINAAKYTAPGGTITVVAQGEGAHVIISVLDSGRGIAPEAIPGVFDLFSQSTGSRDGAEGGLGVGLTVVKHIVELHGGTVSAHSPGLGLGTQFIVRLPIAAAEAAAAVSAPSAPGAGMEGMSLRVLVVDDNEDAANMLGETLQLIGCSVQIAHDGTAALAAFTVAQPDLVLLDIGLPDIDGYEVARRMRSSSAGASTRIVAVTGYGQDADRGRSREVGISEHMVKPVFLEDLQGVLLRCREEALMHGMAPAD